MFTSTLQSGLHLQQGKRRCSTVVARTRTMVFTWTQQQSCVGEWSFNEPPGRETTPAWRRHRRGRHRQPRVSSGLLHPTTATTPSPKILKRPVLAGERTAERGGIFFIRIRGPPHRTNTHRHIAAQAAKVTASKHRRPPPTARPTPPPPTKATALDSKVPAQAAQGSIQPPASPTRHRLGRAGEEDGREDGRRVASRGETGSPPDSLPPCCRERSPERRSLPPPSPILRAWPADASGDGEGRRNDGGGSGGARSGYRPPGRPRGGDPP
jgi:hypothetical protein